MYPFINFFGHSIATYSLIGVVAALLCCGLFLFKLSKTGPLMMEDGVLFLLFVMLGVFVGSHLLYAITQYSYIPYLFERVEFSLWIQRFLYIFGGSVFYGGLIGGIGFGYIGLKILKRDIATYSDLIAPFLALFHGISRIGCFFAGCCYGVPCKWGFTVYDNPIIPEINGVSRFPTPLLEALCNIILSGVLLLLLKRSERYPALRGKIFTVYLLIYGVIRFFDEFLRGDEARGYWGVFSTSQWIAIAMIIVSSIVLAVSVKRQKKFVNP